MGGSLFSFFIEHGKFMNTPILMAYEMQNEARSTNQSNEQYAGLIAMIDWTLYPNCYRLG